MTTQQKPSKTTQSKKVSKTSKTTAKAEIPAISKEKSLPKRYYVQFWKQIEPSDPKFDAIVGTIYWSDVKQDILIEGLESKYAGKIRTLLNSDLKLPDGVFISIKETPKDWVRKLHKAIFVDGFYAKQYMEILDETK